MNIAVLSIHSSPVGPLGTRDTGGMSVYLMETAELLGRRGHCVDVFTLQRQSLVIETLVLFKNVRLIFLPSERAGKSHKDNLIAFIPDLFQSFEKFIYNTDVKYSLLHSHYWISGLLGQKICEKYNIPHLITFHTLGAVKNKTCRFESESHIRIANEKKLAEQNERVIVFTQEEKESINKIYGVVREGIEIVPCGVNTRRFFPVNQKVARTKLGWPDNEKILLYVGRFVSVKGVERLVNAILHLEQDFAVTLILVGDSESLENVESLKKLVSSQLEGENIGTSIIFAGRVDQDILPYYYSAADVFVVPSYHESFCLVAFEALACGTPVLGTEVGGLSLVIENGSGLLVPDINSDILKDAMQQIFYDQNTGILSAADIRQKVKAFSWDKVVDKLEQIYESVGKDKGVINGKLL